MNRQNILNKMRTGPSVLPVVSVTMLPACDGEGSRDGGRIADGITAFDVPERAGGQEVLE